MFSLFTIASASMVLASFNLMVPVQITGAVKNPGPVFVTEASSLRSAVQLAGGFTTNADLRAVEVRAPNGDSKKWDLYALGLVQSVKPGDTVIVPTLDLKSVVLVNGRVANPSPITYRQGLTLADVLAEARIVRPEEINHVTVTSAEPGIGSPNKTYKMDGLALVAPTIAMLPGDRVNVPYSTTTLSDKDMLTVVLIVLLVILIAK